VGGVDEGRKIMKKERKRRKDEQPGY